MLDADGKRRIQEVVGVLLYHTRVLNCPALVSLSDIGTEQAQPMTNTAVATTKLLNYCATYPNPTLHFIANDMILRLFSDAFCLSVSKSRARVAGYFNLSSAMPSDTAEGAIKHSVTPKLTPNVDPPPLWNGSVHILCHILLHVMASTTKVEIGTVFKICQSRLFMRTALQEMGHPQFPTPVEVDNQCTVGILTDTVKQIRSKSVDMRFFWARDRIRQGHFFYYWRPG